MSYTFKTDNIFYSPPKQPLRIYDLAAWRKTEFRTQSLVLGLDAGVREAVSARAEAALELAPLAAPPDEDEDFQQGLARFLQALPYLPLADAWKAGKLEAAFGRLRPTFWAKISQRPVESFFPDDYEEMRKGSVSRRSFLTRCIGSVAFNALGDLECALPDSEHPSIAIGYSGKEEIVAVETLDPLEPLPIMQEYCGLQGASNQGSLVTLNLQSGIPDASLAATPIGRMGTELYATLYFHLQIPQDPSPILPYLPSQEVKLSGRLREAGFTPVRRGKRFSILTRGEDVIHVYRELPGKESEGVPTLPSFVLAVAAGGSTALAGRTILLAEIVRRPAA